MKEGKLTGGPRGLQTGHRKKEKKKKSIYAFVHLFKYVIKEGNSLEAQEDCRLDTEKKSICAFVYLFKYIIKEGKLTGGPRGLQTGHRKKKVFMHLFIYLNI